MGCKRIWWLVVFESSKMSFFFCKLEFPANLPVLHQLILTNFQKIGQKMVV